MTAGHLVHCPSDILTVTHSPAGSRMARDEHFTFCLVFSFRKGFITLKMASMYQGWFTKWMAVNRAGKQSWNRQGFSDLLDYCSVLCHLGWYLWCVSSYALKASSCVAELSRQPASIENTNNILYPSLPTVCHEILYLWLIGMKSYKLMLTGLILLRLLF